MEKLVLPAFIALVVAFIFSNGFAALYNVFIGIPKGLSIKKNKNYKTVTATRVDRGPIDYRDMMNGEYEGSHKNVFEYEWEAEGKRYKKSIRTATWPAAVDTFYYLDNPKYAMPDPKELANFKHTKALFLVAFVCVFLFVFSKS